MNFAFAEEHTMVTDMVRDFAQEQLAPAAGKVDQSAGFPTESLKEMSELGLMGVTIPGDFEGSEMDFLSYTMVVEEISRGCASTGIAMTAQNSLVAHTLYKYGNDEQKKKYLPDIASGKKLGAYAMMETGMGKHVVPMTTTVKKESDGYIVDGKKAFVINGTEAELFIVFGALSEGDDGLCCLVVEKGSSGLKIGEKEDLLGLRAAGMCEVSLEGCKVPLENLIGREGQGLEIALQGQDMGRLGLAALLVGVSQAAYEASLKYSQERKQFGQAIFNFHMIQSMLVQMASEIESVRLMVYKTAWLADQGQKFTKEASMTKLLAGEIAVRSTLNAIQVHGGYGYTKEYTLERHLRDAKVAQILEGTSEEQKTLIARELVAQ